MATPRPINEGFNESYDQAGLQPSTGTISSVRNVKVEEGNDPKKRRGGIKNNPKYQAVAANDDNWRKKKSNKRKKGGNDKFNPIENGLNPRAIARGFVTHSLSRKGAAGATTATSAALKMKARAKATRINIGILQWGFYSWLFFQLPIGILGIITFGLTSAAYSSGLGFIAMLFAPENLYFLTHMLIFAYGMFILTLMYLIYTLALLKPLGGDGQGSKFVALLLAVVGYSVPMPMFNLFPWFVVWAIAVWLKPK